MSDNLRSRTPPTAKTICRLAVKLSLVTGYDLIFSIERDRLCFSHRNHPTLGTSHYLVFAFCPTRDVLYEAIGTDGGYFHRSELEDIEEYLRRMLICP